MKVPGKLIYVISGMPENGKTFLAHSIMPHYKNARIVHIDKKFADWIYTSRPELTEGLTDIYTLFNGLSYSDKTEFYNYFYKTFDNILKLAYNVVLVEGYICEFLSFFKYKDLNAVYQLRCQKEKSGYKYYWNDFQFPLSNYEEVIYFVHSQLYASLQIHTTYQTYQTLGQKKINSDSVNKFIALGISDIIKGKTFLDIGCNTGYFVNKAAYFGASKAVGIDLNLSSVKAAALYSNAIFQYSNTEYYSGDFFSNELKDGSFDIITCASTFHYFGDKQKHFFQRCFQLIKPGGLLVLECGISSENEGEIHVQKHVRNEGEEPCCYPNHYTLMSYASDYSGALMIGDSVKQPGDSIQRIVYHFSKPK